MLGYVRVSRIYRYLLMLKRERKEIFDRKMWPYVCTHSPFSDTAGVFIYLSFGNKDNTDLLLAYYADQYFRSELPHVIITRVSL